MKFEEKIFFLKRSEKKYILKRFYRSQSRGKRCSRKN